MRTGALAGLIAGVGILASVAVGRQSARPLSATLSADNVPGKGAAGGTGSAQLDASLGQEQLCYTVTLSGVAGATASHVHLGAEGSSGPAVVTLGTPSSGTSKGCLNVNRALVRDLLEAPGDYYVDVHSAEYPKGAVRGQLGR
jgi:hypothetical protein